MNAILNNIQILSGFYPRRILTRLKNLPWFYKKKKEFIKSMGKDTDFKITRDYWCLTDISDNSGTLSKHYFKQDLYYSQKIYENHPVKHVDIGSRIDGFVAHLATFMEVEVMDVRPLPYKIKNIKFIQADLMSEDFPLVDYCNSLSCFHTIEHLGLGRYGDPIDANGHIKGLNNIYKALRNDGIFYFSVPIGQRRIEYNAHRVFDVEYLLHYFSDKYELLSFSYLDDNDNMHENIDLNDTSVDCNYGCGMFILKKISK